MFQIGQNDSQCVSEEREQGRGGGLGVRGPDCLKHGKESTGCGRRSRVCGPAGGSVFYLCLAVPVPLLFCMFSLTWALLGSRNALLTRGTRMCCTSASLSNKDKFAEVHKHFFKTPPPPVMAEDEDRRGRGNLGLGWGISVVLIPS